MKNFRTALLCACLSLYGFCAMAQNNPTPLVNEPDYNKPQLFAGIPENILVNIGKLAEILNAKVGSPVDISIGEVLPFKGRVVSLAKHDLENLTSIVARSTNLAGATLTLSRVIVEGKVMYSGRILSLQHGDLLELQQKEGNYMFVKRKLYDLMNE